MELDVRYAEDAEEEEIERLPLDRNRINLLSTKISCPVQLIFMSQSLH
jgi:hypothetical protein